MKIKLSVSDENYDSIRQFLLDKGIELDDDSPFILTEKGKYSSHISARDPKGDCKVFLHTDDIVYIESFGHTVDIHTKESVYQSNDRLYQLCTLLDPGKFLRISNSVLFYRKKG